MNSWSCTKIIMTIIVPRASEWGWVSTGHDDTEFFNRGCDWSAAIPILPRGRNGFLPYHAYTPLETKMRQGKKGRKVETKTDFFRANIFMGMIFASDSFCFQNQKKLEHENI